MPLHAAISYFTQRCSRQQSEASKAVFFALCEDKLQAIANKLVRDLARAPGLIRDRDQPRGIVGHVGTGYADAGVHPVPSKVWRGCSWLQFAKRASANGNPQFSGEEVGVVYSNPTIATTDIDAWFDREGQTDSGDIMPTYPTSGYMKAELCLNGHVITGDIQNEPEKTSKFCGQCGARTVRNCPECDAPFRGDHVYNGQIHAWTTPPSYCYCCGGAFPWTLARVAAAKEHAAEIEGLDEHERQQLPGIIDDLASGGPRTELAVGRFNRIMKKVAPTVGSVLQRVVVDVASETAKKLLGSL
jgi:hypothetical protein